MNGLNGSNGHGRRRSVDPVFEANMSSAMRSHYLRGQEQLMDEKAPMPFDELLMREDDGIDGGEGDLGDYERLQRMMGARAFLRYIKKEGCTLPRIMKNMFAAGRAMHDPFFSSLTMTEAGLMFSETKAAHSFRCKLLSGEIKLAGAHGVRLPGQKTPDATPNYSGAQKGNKNRLGGRKRRAPGPTQKSFLKQLHVGKAKS